MPVAENSTPEEGSKKALPCTWKEEHLSELMPQGQAQVSSEGPNAWVHSAVPQWAWQVAQRTELCNALPQFALLHADEGTAEPVTVMGPMLQRLHLGLPPE